jgi:hypothetical protein
MKGSQRQARRRLGQQNTRVFFAAERPLGGKSVIVTAIEGQDDPPLSGSPGKVRLVREALVAQVKSVDNVETARDQIPGEPEVNVHVEIESNKEAGWDRHSSSSGGSVSQV